MQKEGIIVLLGLFLSLLASAQSQTCVEDEFEPNNDLASAIPAVFSSTLKICQVSSGSSGGDWFGPYNLADGQTFLTRIDFDAAEGNLDLRLTNFAGSQVGISGFATRPFEEVSITGSESLPQVWVQVFLVSDAGQPGIEYQYMVTLGDITGCLDDNLEENDDIGSAVVYQGLATSCDGDLDYYGPIELGQSEILEIELFPVIASDVLSLKVLSSTEQLLTEGSQISGAIRLQYESTAEQSVFLLIEFVSSGSDQESVQYVFSYSVLTTCNDNDGFEPNSILELPAPLPPAAVNLIACFDSPDFFGPVSLGPGVSVTIDLQFTTGNLVDIRLRGPGDLLTPSVKTSTSASLHLEYLHPDTTTSSMTVEVFILSNPSGTGVNYNIFSSVSLSCDLLVCPDGEVCSNGACICQGGAPRNDDGECEAGDLCAEVVCPEPEFCSNGVCLCPEGQSRDQNGICRSFDLCANVLCPPDEVCLEGDCVCESGLPKVDGSCAPDPCLEVVCDGVNEVCQDSNCVCDTGFGRNQDGVCVDICEVTVCGENSDCQAGVCVCRDGFVEENGNCVPPPACPGIVCPEFAFCEEPGICICEPGFESSAGGSEVPTFGTCLTVPCFNFACPENAQCSENQCFCNQGFLNPANDGTSVPQDGVCEVDPCASIICSENSNCVDGTCFCNQGFVRNSAGNCVVDPCIGITCVDPVATCFNGVCLCPEGFDQEGEFCIERGPDACFPQDCVALGALCDEGSGICRCDQNFVFGPSGTCVFSSQSVCDFVSCPSNSACVNGYCYCNDGFREDMGECLPADLGECSPYRGFTDETIVTLMRDGSLPQALTKFQSLQDELDFVAANLPEYEDNECCSGNNYMYPIELTEIAEDAWAFLVEPSCSLDRYNRASQEYNQDLKY